MPLAGAEGRQLLLEGDVGVAHHKAATWEVMHGGCDVEPLSGSWTIVLQWRGLGAPAE